MDPPSLCSCPRAPVPKSQERVGEFLVTSNPDGSVGGSTTAAFAKLFDGL